MEDDPYTAYNRPPTHLNQVGQMQFLFPQLELLLNKVLEPVSMV